MTKKIGVIKDIIRYPVKSMAGESVDKCQLSELGIPGDRGWAIIDEASKEIRGAKKLPKLMQCKAAFIEEPFGKNIPHIKITFPDGTQVDSDAPKVDEKLSDFLGVKVNLMPRKDPADEEHYRRKQPLDEKAIREMMGRDESEELPDFDIFPKKILDEITTYSTPRGTYFDAYPLHILTTSWLAELQKASPDSKFHAERFRPNFVIDTDEEGLAELAWCGKKIQIGHSAVILCDIPTVRCSMTAHATDNLPKDPLVLRTIVKATDQNAGAYANIINDGEITVGDDINLV